jgi:hypothetical protein
LVDCQTVRHWEIIADNLHDAGWSLGWVSAIDCEGRTIWIADAHRGDGKRFVLRVILSISRNAISFSSARISKLPPQCKK